MKRLVITAAIAFAAALLFVSAAFADRDGARRITVSDDCDAATFNNAGLGAICDPSAGGETTFADFIAEVAANKAAEDWEFDPGKTSVKSGATLNLRNVGGEFHTFTQVANFGPGVVPPLNVLVFGVPGPPLPEFTGPDGPGNPLPPGTRLSIQAPTAPGTYKFQCGIHPWMRTVLKVRR